MARWFRIARTRGWGGRRRLDGHWHLVIVRGRYESGRRIFGAACSPVRLQPTSSWYERGRRSVIRTDAVPPEVCPRCERVYETWPRRTDGSRLRRPWHIRRTVCGSACGGWTQREPQDGEPVPCSGWHRNKRLWCEADARFAIASAPSEEPFFRCTSCAASYRREARQAAERLADGKAVGPWLDLPRKWVIERLMDDPPTRLVA